MAKWTQTPTNLDIMSLYKNGKRVHSEVLSQDKHHEKISVMGNRTLFEGTGIHYSNTGLQIVHDLYINSYFMFLFDLTRDRGALKAHTSLPQNDNIRIELKFSRPLPDSITCLLYLEYDSIVLVNFRENSRPIFNTENGQLADFVYAASRIFFPWYLPLCIITDVTHSPETLHPHCQFRSPNRGNFIRASHTSYTPSSSTYYFDSYFIVPLVHSTCVQTTQLQHLCV
jgi:hypothetical protein